MRRAKRGVFKRFLAKPTTLRHESLVGFAISTLKRAVIARPILQYFLASPPVPPVEFQSARDTPTRAIVLLATAGFASQAQVRVTDSLLPQIAADFDTTVGAAAAVVTAYALAHGSSQLLIGPAGDRFGKYRTISMLALVSAMFVVLCGLAQSLSGLTLARLFAGASAGCVIPLSMAYVGDVTPYERRQTVLGRYLTGQIFGQLFGQAMGGVLGDLFGWRNVFIILGGVFALAAAGLLFELWRNPQTGS